MARMSDHPDFDQSWCKDLLASDITVVPDQDSPKPSNISNSMFVRTLFTDSAIRAYLHFRRPTTEVGVHGSTESCMLASLGDGVDGMTGRAHGGLNALLLDQATGSSAGYAIPASVPPATAFLNVDYKRPINTPTVVLCRSWATKVEGRKVWVTGTIEDGQGNVYASATALYLAARGSML